MLGLDKKCTIFRIGKKLWRFNSLPHQSIFLGPQWYGACQGVSSRVKGQLSLAYRVGTKVTRKQNKLASWHQLIFSLVTLVLPQWVHERSSHDGRNGCYTKTSSIGFKKELAMAAAKYLTAINGDLRLVPSTVHSRKGWSLDCFGKGSDSSWLESAHILGLGFSFLLLDFSLAPFSEDLCLVHIWNYT